MNKKGKLNIKCTHSDCANGLHCFIPTPAMRKEKRIGECRECGSAGIDWKRLHLRSIADAPHTFDSMRKEWVRTFFWEIPLNEKVSKSARRKGKLELRNSVRKTLLATIGKANPFRDGAQTEMPEPEYATSIVPYARHATGTCCRKCAENWHGIERGRALTDSELDYLTALTCEYIEQRIPLTDEGKAL